MKANIFRIVAGLLAFGFFVAATKGRWLRDMDLWVQLGVWAIMIALAIFAVAGSHIVDRFFPQDTPVRSRRRKRFR